MYVRRTRAALALAPLLLALGALAGCQEAEPTPKMPEPTASTSTPTETPTAEEESPEEFIRRWQSAGDEMQVTGDTTEYSRMSPACEPCQAFVDNVEEVYAAGGFAEFEGARITKLERTGEVPPTFDVTKVVPETRIHPDKGGEVETLPAGETTFRVTLRRAGRGWVVTHFSVL